MNNHLILLPSQSGASVAIRIRFKKFNSPNVDVTHLIQRVTRNYLYFTFSVLVTESYYIMRVCWRFAWRSFIAGGITRRWSHRNLFFFSFCLKDSTSSLGRCRRSAEATENCRDFEVIRSNFEGIWNHFGLLFSIVPSVKASPSECGGYRNIQLTQQIFLFVNWPVYLRKKRRFLSTQNVSLEASRIEQLKKYINWTTNAFTWVSDKQLVDVHGEDQYTNIQVDKMLWQS